MGRTRIRRTTVVALALVLLVPALASPALSAPARITRVAVTQPGEALEIRIEATGPVTYDARTLSSPARLVVDLREAILDLAARTIEINRGNVIRVRAAQLSTAPAVARITVDLISPVPYRIAAPSPGTVALTLDFNRVASTAPAPSGAPQATAAGPATITLELRNTELADALSALARLCNVNIVTDTSVKGTVTIRLIAVTCDEALRLILDANNLGYKRIGETIVVMAAEKLLPPPEPPEQPQTIIYTVANGDPSGIAKRIADAIPSLKGRVTADDRAGVVVVTGTASEQQAVQKLLGSMDIRIPQVGIETRVIEISTAVSKELGLKWGITTPSFQWPGPGGFGTIGIASPLINVDLNQLVDEGRARVITAPRVAVLDGNLARIELVDRFPIVKVTVTATGTQISVDFEKIGVILEILPKVLSGDRVQAVLKPSVESITEILSFPTPVPGVVTRVPRIASRSVQTVVIAQSGQPIVIAGLISKEERSTVIKVPLLGDIPILGELFKNTRKDVKETEILFIITPTIFRDGLPKAP